MKHNAETGGLQQSAHPAKLSREMLFLAEQAAEGKLRVLPGREWSLHYPVSPDVRADKLKKLLDGELTVDEVAHDIKPDAIFYDATEIESMGLASVSARVRDVSAFIANYDHPRFARFVQSMRGRDIPIDELDRLYSGVTQSRVQKRMMDSYGSTGRAQIEMALAAEASEIVSGIGDLPRSQKVLKALKLDWLSEGLGLVASEERDRVVSELSGDERALFESLRSSYREYVQRGDEGAYSKLTEAVQDGFPTIQREVESGEQSQSMQELDEKLEQYKDQIKPEQNAGDLATPPDEQDELYTNLPPSGGESGVEREKLVFFEITPPLSGYYANGRKSYYDIDKKTWRKNKKLSSYAENVAGDDRHTIHGKTTGGMKSLPIPAQHSLDVSSLQFKGDRPEISRDQYGCFYIDTNGACDFSIDFLKEGVPFVSPPITEDTGSMYRGQLSQLTEGLIGKLIGSNLQKAEQVRQYILAHHFYPGGGDLNSAKALQLKLLSESTGDNYVQNLDLSEYLECRSADTLGAAICRKAKIPLRFVVGHYIDSVKDNKSLVDETTGHAWTEIWDGKMWRRFDFTPKPKPEDKKKKDGDEKSDEGDAEKAEDGGVDSPQDKDGDEKGEKQDGKGEKADGETGQKGAKQKGSGSGDPTEDMPDSSDDDVQQSEGQLDQAKKEMAQQMAKKQELDDKVQAADKFKDLAKLKEELEESDLLDDLKEDLEHKLDAKEDLMKDKIKEELDQMVDDGFMDEAQREKILQELEEKELAELDRVQEQVERDNRLFAEYEDIKEEIAPLVEEWFRYFAERLPRQDTFESDTDSLARSGSFDRRSVMKARNLLFGITRNPKQIRPSVKPRFMASVLVDVSGSMAQSNKLVNARKLLIFYSELFSRISEAFGYIRFSIDIFSDSVKEIKGFGQDYASPERYDFEDGTTSTVKVRLMQELRTDGGTNMLAGIKKAAQTLGDEVADYPDYASALYFVGDGGDTCGNARNISAFLRDNDAERGFGEHMYSAVLLGDESLRGTLAEIFGDDHTNVAPDFNQLIEQSMLKFNDDIEEYLREKQVN